MTRFLRSTIVHKFNSKISKTPAEIVAQALKPTLSFTFILLHYFPYALRNVRTS